MKKISLLTFLGFFFQVLIFFPVYSQNQGENSGQQSVQYLNEEDWIEIMFNSDAKVRLRNGNLIDLATQALQGTDQVLNDLEWHQWYRFTDVPESTIDDWEVNGERNTGEDIYNLNNIYRLQIPKGKDIWKISQTLEELPGIYLARPVPKPVIPPIPPSYQTNQGYLNPASNNPSGVDALYAWTQTGGTGTGITICDLEYSWNYNHADVTKAFGSQINTNVADPFSNNNHGTAVIGELVANSNGWGTTGICYGSNLKTCGTYYGLPSPSWNVPGAIAVAIANLTAGDIILLEQQWDYSGSGTYIPIEWWLNYSPSAQTNNGVYAAIVNAIANGIHVVEAGGNGSFDTGTLTWFGNSGAIIVGAGGAYSGGTWPEGNLQKLSFSSYGPRFNLQGWGENVVTTGYGDLYSAEGINYYYTSTFSGTSSASPVVAGALACAEGYYLANISATPPTPSYMRTHLVNWGTPQITPPNGNIGPRPNIQAAILNFTISYEYGDAPDPTYPTLLASGGARHTNTGLRLGALIDIEVNGQPNATATGDDINPPGLDDEDGIWWPFNFVPGHGNTIRVTTSGAGYLNAWMDFNKNGSWADANEKIFTNQFLAAGTTDLSMTVPANALPGNTFARFRFSSQQNLGYTGLAPDGEVEDYQITIQEPELMDYGDALDVNYKTLAVSNGARHGNTGPLVFMGNIRDLEIDGQPNVNASGDDFNPIGAMDDEDGVVFNTPVNPGQITTVTITVNIMGGFQQGWIDFNADGDFTDPGEQIISNINPPALMSPYNFNLPAGAVIGTTFARFRYATMPNIPSFGPVPNGEVEDYLIVIGEYDFGDAPDPFYPTLLISNGAYHKNVPPFMGVSIDPEPDGQPDLSATGDDNNPIGFDDEDGIWWACNFVPGHANTVKVTVTGAGFLNAWFDYNIDNDWADPGEQIFTNVPFLASGTYDLTVNVPMNAAIGTTFMRYRFSLQQNLTFTGFAPDGEVEDYNVFIQEAEMMDYGDAPDLNYQTLAVNNGARHAIQPPPGIFMGVQIDYEIDGQPDANATGDDNNPAGADDEEGVVLNTPLIPGNPATVTVTVSITGGSIQGWIDFNADGDWLDPNEQIITNFAAFNFVNIINFNVPAGAVLGSTFARYRYSTMGNLAPYGCAPNGEVEDYQVLIGIVAGDIPVDPDPGGLYTQNEISMALLPGTQPGIPNVLLAAYNDEPYPGGPGLGIAYSNDGGATWNNTHLSYPPDPYGGGFFVDQFDPTATADANGNLYVGHISTDYDWINGPASGLYVEKSTDGGVTWSGPIAVATDGPPAGNPDPNYRFNDRCQMTADIGSASPYLNNIYIVEIKDRGWNSPSPWGDIYFSASTDGGATWSNQVILNGLQSNMANMPVPAVAPDGTIYVCWMDYNVITGGTGTIYLDISTDGGTTWLTSDILVRTVNLPPLRLNGGSDVLAKGAAVIDVSPYNSQEIYISFAEQNMLTMDEADIYFIKSTDGGLNWTNPLRVNDDVTVNDQVLPWMDVKPNGTIDIAWYDRRNDFADLKWDVYIAMSTDGGNTFTPNQIITNVNSSTPNTPSGLWMGEYLGLVTDNSYAYLTFCQALNDVKGDIYFDKIQNPEMHEIDFGDAMDPNYPTLLANDGARHIIDGITFLGASIDPDGDGQPDPMAMGDDNDGNDDEDGITFDWPLGKGNPCKLTAIAAVGGGFLNGWIDFDFNGSWAEAGEQVFTDIPLVAGSNDLTFNVPLNTGIGWTFARFRFSTQAGLGYTGLASNGEVEDYYVEITENPDYKWYQYPDVTLPGLHAHDAVIPPYQSVVLADDWQCNGGEVTDIHWWGNYELDMVGLERRGSGINYFHISIHQDDPSGTCLPLEPEVAGYNVSFLSLVEQNTGLVNNEGCTIYLYEFILPQSFNQEPGARYWLDISAFANDANNPALWRWQEAMRSPQPILCGAATKTMPVSGTWSTIVWNMVNPPRYSDMAFIITSTEHPDIDYGDAGDPPYPTLTLNNGASHIIDGVTYLGLGVDPDPDGQPDPNALGDDNDEGDDEDGVTVIFPLSPGGTAGIDVIASVGGILNGWFDYNANGFWGDPGEQVFIDQALFAGSNWLFFFVPPNAVVGQTYARFRYSSVAGLTFQGLAPDGEVEDHEIMIEGELDFGDAPDLPYPTLLANNGARHLVVPGIYLGTTLDAELNGLQDPFALGDDNNNLDDEDGIFLPVLIAKGQMNTMTVTASVNGILNGWIDFNMDGFWGSDLTEQIFTNQIISAGNNILTFNAPATAGTGNTFARFRFSTIGGLSFTGYAPDGEVEDYQVEIGEPYKWSQLPDLSPNGMDVDATADMGMMMPPCVLADDFLCDKTGPLTRINVWGSWQNDYIPEGPMAVMFILTIHRDIPADQSPTGYSMPGNILWTQPFFPGQFMVILYMPGLMEGWYSPQFGYYTPFGDTQCWLYTFDLTQTEPFIQQGNPDEPVIYWLSVQAIPQAPDPNVRFGWKTSVDQWNDNATWAVGNAPYMGPWNELYHPMTMEPLDLAFEIYGLESPYFLADIYVFLEGPYNGSTMDTDLNVAGLIPLNQPYDTDPLAKWYYTGSEKVPSIPGTDVVDWVLIELRDAPSAPLATGMTRVAQRAAFVLDDGSLVATDGSSLVKFYVSFTWNPFLVIWHRNHLGVLSANPMTPVGPGVYSYDFSSGVGQAYGGASGHKNLGGGIYGMFGGDGVPDGSIINSDKTSVWSPNVGTQGYKAGDYNLDTQVNNPDKNDIWVPNLGQGTQVPN